MDKKQPATEEPVDHSRTYRTLGFRNLPHRRRLAHIKQVVGDFSLPESPRYADFGCSNGYVTEILRRSISAKEAVGYDHQEKHFEVGRRTYPDITFRQLNLNEANAVQERYDLVTCFETLEHVGSPKVALANLVSAVGSPGVGFFSVPIEIGLRGLLKYYAKRAYGYTLDELPHSEGLRRRYEQALWTYGRLSVFRDQRAGWGTHFGFDYRLIDDSLEDLGVPFEAHNAGTTRFYVVKRP